MYVVPIEVKSLLFCPFLACATCEPHDSFVHINTTCLIIRIDGWYRFYECWSDVFGISSSYRPCLVIADANSWSRCHSVNVRTIHRIFLQFECKWKWWERIYTSKTKLTSLWTEMHFGKSWAASSNVWDRFPQIIISCSEPKVYWGSKIQTPFFCWSLSIFQVA